MDYLSKMEVFQEVNLKPQEGLQLIFTKNNREFGLVNSENVIIEQIGKNRLTLKFEDDKLKAITLNQLKHIDYGYCVTIHGAQGKTFANTIAAIDNNQLLNTQRMWLVALSRHKDQFTALVEDKNQLKSYLLKNTGTILSAIELHSKIEARSSGVNIGKLKEAVF